MANEAPAVGLGYAALTVNGSSRLFGIGLASGTAENYGVIGSGAAIRGLTGVDFDTFGQPFVLLTADPQQRLLRIFNTNLTSVNEVDVSGVSGDEVLVGLDYRPATGQLYALGVDATNDVASLYVIDPFSGAATLAVPGTQGAISFDGVDLPDPTVVGYGFDFNPTVDRIRVVAASGFNARLNPVTGGAVDGDPGVAGTQPDGDTGANISAVAYTNSFNGATATTLYRLNDNTDTLAIQNPPNAGGQTNVVPGTLEGLPLNFSGFNAFNISRTVVVGANNDVATGMGIAVLQVAGVSTIYYINLATGEAVAGINFDATPIVGIAGL